MTTGGDGDSIAAVGSDASGADGDILVATSADPGDRAASDADTSPTEVLADSDSSLAGDLMAHDGTGRSDSTVTQRDDTGPSDLDVGPAADVATGVDVLGEAADVPLPDGGEASVDADTPLRAAGGVCDDDVECATGYCQNGHCCVGPAGDCCASDGDCAHLAVEPACSNTVVDGCLPAGQSASCVAFVCVTGEFVGETPCDGPCDDGNACTQGDVCDAGTCLSGEPNPACDVGPCATDGADLFEAILDTLGEATLEAVVALPDGGAAAAGWVEAAGGDEDGVIVRVGPDGELDWGTPVGEAGDERLTELVPRPDGGFFAAGRAATADEGKDAWLVSVGPGGAVEWSESYGGPGDQIAHALLRTSDGAVLLAGSSQSGADQATDD